MNAMKGLLNPPRHRSTRVAGVVFAIAGSLVLLVSALSSAGDSFRSAAQGLCENNDNPVATIAPCAGPIGTVIKISVARRLPSPPAALIFTRVLANGVPARISAGVSSSSAKAPAQICAAGSARWEVLLFLANGQSQGKIGAFWPDCRGTPSGNTGNAAGKGSGGNNGAGSSSNNPIVLPAIEINVDNDAYAKTKASGQSDLSDITSSNSAVATAREWGTNDVQIHGKRPGVATINFYDRETDTYYRVQVTVNAKPKSNGGDGAGLSLKPGQMDKCLVGDWIGVHIEDLKDKRWTGGTGFKVSFKTDGTQTIDYSAMLPIVFENDSFTWRGTSVSKITAADGRASLLNVVPGNLTMQAHSVFNSTMKFGRSIGPGGLGGLNGSTKYACSENSLEYETTWADDKHPSYRVKLERRK